MEGTSTFKIIVLTETWNKDQNIMKNSLLRLQNYKIVHQDRTGEKGGGVCIFVHNSFNYRIRYDMSLCVDGFEYLCVEIITKHEKMLLLPHYIGHQMVKIKPFKHYIKELFSNNAKTNKSIYLAGDLNLITQK